MIKKIATILISFLFIGPIISQEINQITYIANEGVFIEYKGKKVLIDALHKKYTPTYQHTKRPYPETIISGTAPFDNINLYLVTHIHGDHFDEEFMLKYLEKHEESILVAPQQVLDTMKNWGHLAPQFYPLRGDDKGLMYEMEGIAIHAIPLIHSFQKRNYWVENMGYLLDFEGLKILHIGDAELNDENFDRIQKAIGKGVDYALLPDWYFSKGDHLKKLKQKIKAKKYLAIHVMKTESGLYESRLKKRVKDLNIDLNVFMRIGEFEKIEK